MIHDYKFKYELKEILNFSVISLISTVLKDAFNSVGFFHPNSLSYIKTKFNFFYFSQSFLKKGPAI